MICQSDSKSLFIPPSTKFMTVVQLTEDQVNAVERTRDHSNQALCIAEVKMIVSDAITSIHEKLVNPETAPDQSFEIKLVQDHNIGPDKMKTEFKMQYKKKQYTRIASVQPLN